jgi:predicted nucleic acid-binding Zn ribbon protein
MPHTYVIKVGQCEVPLKHLCPKCFAPLIRGYEPNPERLYACEKCGKAFDFFTAILAMDKSDVQKSIEACRGTVRSLKSCLRKYPIIVGGKLTRQMINRARKLIDSELRT